MGGGGKICPQRLAGGAEAQRLRWVGPFNKVFNSRSLRSYEQCFVYGSKSIACLLPLNMYPV